MWNLWYITFGLLTLFVIGLAIGVALTIKKRHYRKLVKNTQIEIRSKRNNIIVSRSQKEIEELEGQRDELIRQKGKYEDIYDNTNPFIVWLITTIAGYLSICFLLPCIICPVSARKEVNYFIVQKEYVEMAIENGSELENIAITQIVIEQNQWLANAKANAQTYGAWSVYYGIDFSNLSPIEINRE